MVDVFTPEKRSWIMAQIKSKDTRMEINLRKSMYARGYRFRKNDSRLPGKPDLVFPKYKGVVFVNGCFWHFHECHHSSIPEIRRAWWITKFTSTRERDIQNRSELVIMGWRILTVWECAFKATKNNSSCLFDIVEGWLLSMRPSVCEVDYNLVLNYLEF